MSQRYKQQNHFSGATRFTKAPMAEVEYSRMTNDPTALVPMNAGDLVPVLCFETLPHSTYELDFEHITRLLSASMKPTMGSLIMDIFAFEVPHRVVNDSWRNVQGENTSDYWVTPDVQLAPLYEPFTSNPDERVQVRVGSVADLYGFPTQYPIHFSVLASCHDLKFRGYVSVWNEYFRSSAYQPCIPYSKLNVYNGFFSNVGVTLNGFTISNNLSVSDGSYPNGAVIKALYGSGVDERDFSSGNNGSTKFASRLTTFSALGPPLKVNKLHDPFTSVLPSPQRGPEVTFSVSGEVPVTFGIGTHILPFKTTASGSLKFAMANGSTMGGVLGIDSTGASFQNMYEATVSAKGDGDGNGAAFGVGNLVKGWNIEGSVDLADSIGISVNELRTAIATQQVYEQLARGGSRYWEFLKSFFGIEVDNPFPDIPTQIGHYRCELDMYQVAQTSATQQGGTTQGSLTAFGYTAKGGAVLRKTCIEYGYIHVFAVIRHRNLYSTYLAPDNFRRRTLDFYMPQFANIGEQPVRKAVLNPFASDAMEKAIGYQEAFWEYRYMPDSVVGALRSGIEGSLDVWHYGDDVDNAFDHVNGEWLVSNTQEVLDRTLFVTSDVAPQFLCQFTYKLKKQLPMPVYSVPGLDTI